MYLPWRQDGQFLKCLKKSVRLTPRCRYRRQRLGRLEAPKVPTPTSGRCLTRYRLPRRSPPHFALPPSQCRRCRPPLRFLSNHHDGSLHHVAASDETTILATMRHGCSILTATISRSFIKAKLIFIVLIRCFKSFKLGTRFAIQADEKGPRHCFCSGEIINVRL
jgi:hypothetical protein